MTLEELVSSYGEHNNTSKSLAKVMDEEKAEIKRSLETQGVDTFTAGGYTVKRSVVEKTVLDEAKALEVLKNYWKSNNPNDNNCPFVQIVEVLDFDALENALYKGTIPTSVQLELKACESKSTTVKLLCNKTKKEDLENDND